MAKTWQKRYQPRHRKGLEPLGEVIGPREPTSKLMRADGKTRSRPPGPRLASRLCAGSLGALWAVLAGWGRGRGPSISRACSRPLPQRRQKRSVPAHDSEPDGKRLLAHPDHCRGRGPGLFASQGDLLGMWADQRFTVAAPAPSPWHHPQLVPGQSQAQMPEMWEAAFGRQRWVRELSNPQIRIMQKMASTREHVTFPGVLRGQGHEATCTVSAIKVTLSGTGVAAYTQYSIERTSKTLPDGEYQLSVNDQSIPMRYYNGNWLAAS